MSIIHMSFTKVFRYKGVTIDWHKFCGPVILNRHTEKERQFKNVSLRVWNLVNKFASLSEKDREQYKLDNQK
jgi:hypothetical protein